MLKREERVVFASTKMIDIDLSEGIRLVVVLSLEIDRKEEDISFIMIYGQNVHQCILRIPMNEQFSFDLHVVLMIRPKNEFLKMKYSNWTL